jgi:predicted glycosyltransferase
MDIKKIIIYMQHPAEAKMYRYLYKDLINDGISIKIAIMEREDIVGKIVSEYTNNYEVIGYTQPNIVQKGLNLIKIDKNLYQLAKKFKPDLITSFSSPYPGHIASMLNFAHIGYCDTEEAHLNTILSYSFQDTVLTPSCYLISVPKNKHIRFNGYKELAYLHPKYFKPNSKVLDELGLSKNDKIILIRFSSKDATHDIGNKIINTKEIDNLYKKIKEIEEYATVLISSSEIYLGKRFEKYYLNINPNQYDDLLSFCNLYMGEGSTTASEAGIMGVPWIFLQDIKLGYLWDQENNYGLGFQIPNIKLALNKVLEIISNNNIPSEWKIRRKKLLADKIDVTSFLSWFIRNYPESHEIMHQKSNYDKRFK